MTVCRWVVIVVLVVVGIVHVLPLVGVLGDARLRALYGVTLDDSQVTLLLRHRAVLFGLLGAFLFYAASQPALHRVGLVAGSIAVGSFLVLARDGTNAALARVVNVDRVLFGLLLVGWVASAIAARR